MPATLEILEDNRVVCLVFTAPLLLEEIFDVYVIDKAFRDRFNHKIHTLVDVRNMGKIPAGILGTRHGPPHTHPNSGYVVVIGANRLARSLGNAMAQLRGANHFRFFDSDEEAWMFLRATIESDKQTGV